MRIVTIALLLSYTMADRPPLFEYQQSTVQAFYFFKDVTLNGENIAVDDWVATFNCNKWNSDSTSCLEVGPCVGARQWDTRTCGGGVCDLPAMGDGEDGTEKTKGYLKTGEYPLFMIYDKSAGVYYSTTPGDEVTEQSQTCRNGYPYCYGWKNFGFMFVPTLAADSIYSDCTGLIGGKSKLDACGICGGGGPQFICESTGKTFCSEYEYNQKCSGEAGE